MNMAYRDGRFHRNLRFTNKRRDELSSARMERFQTELRLTRSRRAVPDENRPYGLSWEDQGAAEDVWWMILCYITDPKEIMKMYEVSDLFRALLKRRFIQVVLPKILDVCVRHCWKSLVRKPEPREDPDYLVLGVRLKFRLLSRLTKRSMEDFFHEIGDPVSKGSQPQNEEQEDNSDLDDDDEDGGSQNRAEEEPQELESEADVIPDIQLYEDERLEALLRKIDRANIQNDGTFFPQRLHINEENLTNPETQIASVLQRIGRSVRRLEYIPCPRFTRYPNHPRHRSYKAIYTALRQWLQQTPNLEILEINPHKFKEPYLMSIDTVSSFTTCPNLKIFKDDYNFPAVFRARILQANPTINVLAHGRRDWVCDRKRLSSLCGVYLPGIHELADLQLEEWGSLSRPSSAVFNFSSRWPLKRVCIADRDPACPPVLSSELFRFLNSFKNTLEDVRLDIPVRDDCGDLDLPNVTWFGWRLQKLFPSFDFIISFEKLTHFDIYDDEGMLKATDDEDSNVSLERPSSDILEFYDAVKSENFRRTDMDKLFPRLNRIKIFRSDGSIKRFYLLK